MVNKKAVLIVLIISGAVSFFLNHKYEIYTRAYLLTKPCGIYFSDIEQKWTNEQKDMVLRACKYFEKDNLILFRLNPTFIFLEKGEGKSYTVNNNPTQITLVLKNMEDTDKLFKTVLYEIAKAMDIKRGGMSLSTSWILATDWKCENLKNLDTCTHKCKDTKSPNFLCHYTDQETLPSDYELDRLNPKDTNVGSDPADDFAKSAVFFITKNDLLNTTSEHRCRYFKTTLLRLGSDSCFDCNASTICK